jgi:hypothetical protein
MTLRQRIIERLEDLATPMNMEIERSLMRKVISDINAAFDEGVSEGVFEGWYARYKKEWQKSEDEPPDYLVAEDAWKAAIIAYLGRE